MNVENKEKDNKESIKEIEKAILDLSIKICKRGEGGMFILGEDLNDFSFLVNQDFNRFNILDNPKTAESLALQDGAVWIKNNGELIGYGIMMTKPIPVLNKGTRHASAVSASSQNGNKVFLISQEDKKIKIFKQGEIIMQLDVLEEGVEKNTGNAINILESVGAGAGATILAGMVFPAVAIAVIPGIFLFGSSHFIIKTLVNKGK